MENAHSWPKKAVCRAFRLICSSPVKRRQRTQKAQR